MCVLGGDVCAAVVLVVLVRRTTDIYRVSQEECAKLRESVP